MLLSCWLLMALFSCSDKDVEAITVLEIKKDTVVFTNSAASSQNLEVIASDEWNAVVAEDCDWCRCTVNSGLTNYLKIDVDANSALEERWTTITVTSKEVRKDLKVCQFGAAPAIIVQPAAFGNVSFEPSELKMTVIANVKLDISLVDTITWLTKTEEKTMGDSTFVVLRTTVNPSKAKRETKITIKQHDGELTKWVTVTQNGRTDGYEVTNPDGVEGDSILPISSGRASSFQPGGEIEKSFDGNMNTLYHSKWSNGNADYFPITLEYNFENIDRMDYLVYYPRTNGANGRFKEVEIWYKTQENPTYTKFSTFDFQGSDLASRVDFPQGVVHPTGVRFVVNSGAGDGQGFASCAEMRFFQKKATASSIFSDRTYSELNPDVTYEQIMEMDNEFLQNIAKALYLGTYPAEQRVRTYEPYRDPEAIAKEYKINIYNKLDNPTGMYVKSGEELVVCVGDIPSGERIGLTVMDWEQGYSATNYTLQPGINKITSTSKGLLYVIYNTENYESASPVKIHIATGTFNGEFDLSKHSDTDWQNLLKSASVSGYLDLRGEYAQLTFPISYYKNNVSSPTDLLKAYDKMVWLEHDLMGLHKYNHTIKNRMFFHAITDDGSYMYATSYRTAYHVGTLNEILNVNKFKTSGIWGPAHEVGHMHQTRPGLKWVGTTEVTNNIHSLHVQTTFGNRSRLITENMGDGTTRFEKAFASLIAGKIAHGKEGDVFCKLVPFYQLYLYSTKINTQYEDYYKDLHELIRQQTDPANADTKNGICQLNFVKMTCDLLELDLTDYFRAWGFLREIDERIDDYGVSRLWITADQITEIENYIASKGYSQAPGGLIYLNDDNIAYFTNGQAMQEGAATRSGNRITVSNSSNVVAFEVYQNETLVKAFNNTAFNVPEGTVIIKAVSASGERKVVPVS